MLSSRFASLRLSVLACMKKGRVCVPTIFFSNQIQIVNVKRNWAEHEYTLKLTFYLPPCIQTYIHSHIYVNFSCVRGNWKTRNKPTTFAQNDFYSLIVVSLKSLLCTSPVVLVWHWLKLSKIQRQRQTWWPWRSHTSSIFQTISWTEIHCHIFTIWPFQGFGIISTSCSRRWWNRSFDSGSFGMKPVAGTIFTRERSD
mgnify:CR=1 FL=1